MCEYASQYGNCQIVEQTSQRGVGMVAFRQLCAPNQAAHRSRLLAGYSEGI